LGLETSLRARVKKPHPGGVLHGVTQLVPRVIPIMQNIITLGSNLTLTLLLSLLNHYSGYCANVVRDQILVNLRHPKY
jgi:hypothetical protein